MGSSGIDIYVFGHQQSIAAVCLTKKHSVFDLKSI